MKKKSKKINVYIMLLGLVVLGCLIYYAVGSVYNNSKENNENEEFKIYSMSELKQIIVKYDGKEYLIEDNQDDFLKLFKPKEEGKQDSITDYPANAKNIIQIDLKLKVNDNIYSFFVYERGNKYFIEKPYQGIWEIKKEVYDGILKYIRKLQE